MHLYVHLSGATRGPLPEDRVQALLAEGVLLASDLAAEQPDGAWKALGTFLRFTIPANAFAPAEEEKIGARPAADPSDATVAPSDQPARTAATVSPGVIEGLAPLAPALLGPYSRSTLAPNERAYHSTSLHWIIFLRFAVIALLVFLFVAMPFAIGVQILTGSQLGWFVLPLPAFIMIPPTLAFASSELVITDRRVLIKSGIVRRQTLEMFIARIESVGVEQGVVGRMLDYGTVTIRGTGGSEEPFEAIARPIEFRNSVQRLQSAAP